MGGLSSLSSITENLCMTMVKKSLLHALKKEEVQLALHLIGSHLLSAISLAVVDLRDLDARY
jgi:hypothetical protein